MIPAALAFAVWIASCGWKVTPPRFPERAPPARRIAEEVVLKVEEGGVVWGGGRLGETVRDTLVTAGSFARVYFPIEPRNPPPLALVVTATGTVDEEVFLGVVKSVVIGAFFFAPVGIIRFNKSFDLDAAVALLDRGREVHRFQVKTSTGVSHTMFSQITQYEAEARNVAFRDLGTRIASELAVGKIEPPAVPD